MLQNLLLGYDKKTLDNISNVMNEETYDLNVSMSLWVYLRLKTYLELSQETIDLKSKKFTVPVVIGIDYEYENVKDYKEINKFNYENILKIEFKEKTFKDCIELTIKYLENYILSDNCTNETQSIEITKRDMIGVCYAKNAFHIISIIFPSLWW